VSAEDRPLAVTGVPDESKGEALVLLAVMDVDLAALRKQLSADGMPNLWIPRRMVKVPAIPYLPTGKLDLRRIQELAAAGV
jgi:acyl-[acyl-carrier-protein]-phospholipid O-acyltransferase/long-chain-fatty-acid--[acyl-carrier-protein] ligase